MTQITSNFKRETLKNGLRLITVPMASTQTVTVLVMVATGSRYENKKNNGISHFLEHMMFKGTKRRPTAMSIAEELDSIGAEYNAFTWKEYTGYYIKCAAEKYDIGMDIIADIFQNSLLDEKEIDKERGPIKEEINMYLDTPSRHVGDIFDDLVYGDQPLGWNTAGTKEVIDSLKRSDFVDYFKTHYFAGNTVIAVAGNVESTKVKASIEKYFAEIRQHDPISAEPVIVNQVKASIKGFYKKTDQSHIIIGFHSYSYLDDKFPTVALISTILGGGMSSRLFSEVREKRGLAYRVSAGVYAFNETGLLVCSAGLNNDKLVPALEVILNEFKRLVDEPITDKELTKAKDYTKGITAIGLESSDAQASYYADQELLENNIMTIEEKLDRVNAITVSEIQAVSRELIKGASLNLAFVGPFKEDDEKIMKVINNF